MYRAWEVRRKSGNLALELSRYRKFLKPHRVLKRPGIRIYEYWNFITHNQSVYFDVKCIESLGSGG